MVTTDNISTFFEELLKSISDFKTSAMDRVMKNRSLDADTIDKLGKLSMAIDNATGDISWMRQLYEELTAEPAAATVEAQAGMQAKEPADESKTASKD